MEERRKCIEQYIVDAREEDDETLQEAFYALGMSNGGEDNTPLEDNPFEEPPPGVFITGNNPDDPMEAYHNSAFLTHTSNSAAYHALTKQTARFIRYGKEGRGKLPPNLSHATGSVAAVYRWHSQETTVLDSASSSQVIN